MPTAITSYDALPSGVRLVLEKRPDHEIARGLIRQHCSTAPPLDKTPKTTAGWREWMATELRTQLGLTPVSPPPAGAPAPAPTTAVTVTFRGPAIREYTARVLGHAETRVEITAQTVRDAVTAALDEDAIDRDEDGLLDACDVGYALARHLAEDPDLPLRNFDGGNAGEGPDAEDILSQTTRFNTENEYPETDVDRLYTLLIELGFSDEGGDRRIGGI